MHSILASAAVLLMAVSTKGAMMDKAAQQPDVGEAYVAELDQDWNVTRERRVPCSIDAGCMVDLGLGHSGSSHVQVRFDGLRSGKVAVATDLVDAAGHHVQRSARAIGIDRSGFGADHFQPLSGEGAPAGEADVVSEGGKPILLMAIKVPGWAASLPNPAPLAADRV